MKKEIPQSSWVESLMDLAKNNQGKKISLDVVVSGEKKSLGVNQLIAIEGDCSGEIVKGFKIAIGDGGSNVFHYVSTPQKIEVIEDENQGTVSQVIIYSADGTDTIIKPIDGEFA